MKTFTLNDKEEKLYEEWLSNLPDPLIYTGAIGGRIVFTFCHTSIGTVAEVRDDITGLECDLTDYASW